MCLVVFVISYLINTCKFFSVFLFSGKVRACVFVCLDILPGNVCLHVHRTRDFTKALRIGLENISGLTAGRN